MAAIIYALCALTSLACAVLLLRAFARSRGQLLLWSGLCFVGLTAANTLLVLDRVFLATVDLSTARLAVAFFSLLLLLFGLIWEQE
ncbi:MAG: DUF5985 family protein [Betaproteobacteria bacterium]